MLKLISKIWGGTGHFHSLGVAVMWRFDLWLGGATSKMAHSHGCWPWAQFFSRNLLEVSSDQEVVFLQNEWSKAESKEEATMPSVAYCLQSHTIHFCLFFLLDIVKPPHWGRASLASSPEIIFSPWELPLPLCWLPALPSLLPLFVSFCSASPGQDYRDYDRTSSGKEEAIWTLPHPMPQGALLTSVFYHPSHLL